MNVVLLVLDACRGETLYEEGTCLPNLASNNVRFTRAFAPARWSLPSHVSLLSGSPPSVHGRVTPHSKVESLDFIEQLSDRGYRTVGVSANAFASSRYDFDRQFDEFHETLTRGFRKGVDPDELNVAFDDVETLFDVPRLGVRTLGRALSHRYPIQSVGNVLLFAVDAASPIELGRYHSLFRQPLFSYSPKWDLSHIQSAVEGKAASEGSLFLFANFMDTHSPYWPAPEFQQQVFAETVEYDEIVRLNGETMLPFSFAKKDASGEVNEKDVERVQALYRASVRSADAGVGRVVEMLKSADIWDDTLLVVTADHGEVLGETDELGRRRMGHVDSISDRLFRVPLVIAGGAVPDRTVDDPLTLSDLPAVLESCLDGEPSPRVATDGPVVVELPATEQTDLYDEHPDAPRGMLDRVARQHATVGYEDDWKVVCTSDGSAVAFTAGTERPVTTAPEGLLAATESRLETLESRVDANPEERVSLDDEARDTLADLGYL